MIEILYGTIFSLVREKLFLLSLVLWDLIMNMLIVAGFLLSLSEFEIDFLNSSATETMYKEKRFSVFSWIYYFPAECNLILFVSFIILSLFLHFTHFRVELILPLLKYSLSQSKNPISFSQTQRYVGAFYSPKWCPIKAMPTLPTDSQKALMLLLSAHTMNAQAADGVYWEAVNYMAAGFLCLLLWNVTYPWQCSPARVTKNLVCIVQIYG